MLPLDGVRVLAVEQYGAGPFATLQLADLGAEVIKIENPQTYGDVSRYVPPYRLEQDSLFYQAFNRNKKSIGLNLKTETGRRLFRQLVAQCDVVYSNLRGDQPQRLGVCYEALEDVNPKVVCCNLSGYGMDGPRAAEPGYDYLIQGLAGFMSLTGEPEAPPAKAGISFVDFSTGFASVIGVLAGLRAVASTGHGCQVDVSLLDTAISMLNYLAAWHLNEGYEPQRLPQSAHPTLVPSQIFETADGHIVVMCQKQKFWEALCGIFDRRELLEDARFRTLDDRLEHRDQLIGILAEIFRERTSEDWLGRLRGKVPSAPVNEVRDALCDPQVLARNMIIEVTHPEYGRIREVGSPIKTSYGSIEHRRAPALGEHTDNVLMGLIRASRDDLDRWRKDGVIA